ncbi:hypothetical protein DAPPUDRAFT_251604 [Daphnia pulex]|uniref:Uncharacterized protein n=1 Tax=Daphnia pulex TaxID=6669 RepID=E9H0R1_DAPPU|nr:hypothetical protein DAPPUDRAFT_251604 [Daphnia pulex]|eukprot:EFX74688.1 hypothetical protein DAPPUDRAFT_251604 [Daphnia pulex]
MKFTTTITQPDLMAMQRQPKRWPHFEAFISSSSLGTNSGDPYAVAATSSHKSLIKRRGKNTARSVSDTMGKDREKDRSATEWTPKNKGSVKPAGVLHTLSCWIENDMSRLDSALNYLMPHNSHALQLIHGPVEWAAFLYCILISCYMVMSGDGFKREIRTLLDALNSAKAPPAAKVLPVIINSTG